MFGEREGAKGYHFGGQAKERYCSTWYVMSEHCSTVTGTRYISPSTYYCTRGYAAQQRTAGTTAVPRRCKYMSIEQGGVVMIYRTPGVFSAVTGYYAQQPSLRPT